MLDLKALQVFRSPIGNKVRVVIKDDRVWDPISGDDIVSNEFLHRRNCDSFVGGSFHPLSEVVNRHQNEAMTIRSGRMNGADDINPSSGEGPWQRHVV